MYRFTKTDIETYKEISTTYYGEWVDGNSLFLDLLVDLKKDHLTKKDIDYFYICIYKQILW